MQKACLRWQERHGWVPDGIRKRPVHAHQNSRRRDELTLDDIADDPSGGRISLLDQPQVINVFHEPPNTEPYVRWCGRTGVARLPPTRCPEVTDLRVGLNGCVEGPLRTRGTETQTLQIQHPNLSRFEGFPTLYRRIAVEWRICGSNLE